MEIREGRALFCKYIYSAFANSCPASTESLVADCKVTTDSFIVSLVAAVLGNIVISRSRPQRIIIKTTRSSQLLRFFYFAVHEAIKGPIWTARASVDRILSQ